MIKRFSCKETPIFICNDVGRGSILVAVVEEGTQMCSSMRVFSGVNLNAITLNGEVKVEATINGLPYKLQCIYVSVCRQEDEKVCSASGPLLPAGK